MNENEIISNRPTGIETPAQTAGEIDFGLNNPVNHVPKVRADKLRDISNEPDFGVADIQDINYVFKESNFTMTPEMADEIVRTAGIKKGTGDQISASLENVMTSIGGIGDQTKLAFGNIANWASGGTIGQEWQDTSFRALQKRYADMADTEMAVGGIRSELANIIGDAASFAELALVGFATGGYGSLAQIAIQSQGEGTYNDMEAYAKLHEDDISGYRPSSFDIAANTANTILQVATERYLGVGSPRFLKGASRGLFMEGISGFIQEGVQPVLADLNEVVKGNKTFSDMADNADDYLRSAIIGGILQGAMGAATYGRARANADNRMAQVIAKARGKQTPDKEDNLLAKTVNDAKETGYAIALTDEFKAQFDASTGQGQLQNKIAGELKKYAEANEMDFDLSNETEMAQRIEQIATIETLNALADSQEKGISIQSHELNNVKFADGKLWLAGLEPRDLGLKLRSYESVMKDREKMATPEFKEKQSAKTLRAENKAALDAINAEIQDAKLANAQAKKATAEARVKTAEARKGTAEARAKTAEIKKLKTIENARLEQLRLEKKKRQVNKLENELQAQDSTTGAKGSKRGGYNDTLKYIVLNSNADLSTISHEFAHYWMNNNFKWARSGLASTDWMKRWGAVERALGIKPTDRYLSAKASEQFARMYEAWILKGEPNDTLAWAFEGLQKEYQNIYEEMDSEYFDWKDGLEPDVAAWFNRQMPETFEQSAAEVIQAFARAAVANGNTVVVPIKDGVVVSDGAGGSEIAYNSDVVAKSKLAAKGLKGTDSRLQKSLKTKFGDSIQVDKLETINKADTLENARRWISQDRAGAWDAMTNPNTNILDKTTLYNAFVEMAENDAQLLQDLARHKDLAKEVREYGQAVAMLDITSESGFDMVKIMENMQKAKGEMTQEQFNAELEKLGLNDAELDQADVNALENETGCKL